MFQFCFQILVWYDCFDNLFLTYVEILNRIVDFPERIANLTKIVSEKGPWAENKKLND